MMNRSIPIVAMIMAVVGCVPTEEGVLRPIPIGGGDSVPAQPAPAAPSPIVAPSPIAPSAVTVQGKPQQKTKTKNKQGGYTWVCKFSVEGQAP